MTSLSILYLLSGRPALAQQLNPAAAARAEQFAHNAATSRQQAAALRKSITSWEDGFIKNNRVRAATAPDVRTRTAYANVVKTQEAAVEKMRSQAAFLTKSAEYDDAQAAHIRRHEPVDEAAPVNPAASSGVASAGATAPANNRPGSVPNSFIPRPGVIRTATPTPDDVLAYFAVAKQDVARARKYVAIADAELTSYGPRVDAANALADRLLNKPAAQYVKVHPGSGNASSNHPFTWSISGKEKENWIPQDPLRKMTVSLRDMDSALNPTSGLVRPYVYFDSKAAAQGHNAQLSRIDNIERDLAVDLKGALADRLSLRAQQLRWDMQFLDAQSALRTVINWDDWAKLKQPIYQDLYAKRRLADSNGTFAKLEPGFFANTMARMAPLCTAAAKQDALYVAGTAGRIQTLIDLFKADRLHILDEFNSLVTELYKDKSGAKAELSGAMLPYVQGLIADKSFGAPLAGSIPVEIQWKVWNYDFDGANDSRGGPVVEADARTMLNNPGCASWIDQMPKDLQARFPAITPEFYEHRMYFAVLNVNLINPNSTKTRIEPVEIKFVENLAPYNPIDNVEFTDWFRVEVRYTEDPGSDTVSVSLQTTSGGTFETVATRVDGDRLRYRTSPIRVGDPDRDSKR